MALVWTRGEPSAYETHSGRIIAAGMGERIVRRVEEAGFHTSLFGFPATCLSVSVETPYLSTRPLLLYKEPVQQAALATAFGLQLSQHDRKTYDALQQLYVNLRKGVAGAQGIEEAVWHAETLDRLVVRLGGRPATLHHQGTTYALSPKAL